MDNEQEQIDSESFYVDDPLGAAAQGFDMWIDKRSRAKGGNLWHGRFATTTLS